MKIIEGENIDPKAWEELVKRSSVVTWFQTREAFVFFDSMPFLKAFAFAVESGGQLRGIAVGYVQKDGGGVKSFFSRRAIVIGGPMLDEEIHDAELALLLQSMSDSLKKLSIYFEIRNFNDYGYWRTVFENCGFEYVPHLDIHVDCSSEKEVWKRLKENRRRQIKRAIKEGAHIEEASSEDDIKAFYAILSELYSKRIRKPLFPIEFFLLFYRNGCGKYLLVKYNDKIIGGVMCPIFGGTIYEWFVCGLDFEYKYQYPSVMATWSAIEYAIGHGLHCFDFMGAGTLDERYGVRDFKSRFGGNVLEYGRYLNVYNRFLFAVGAFGVKLLKLK